MNILEQLQSVFRDVFDDETIILTEETTSRDIEDWDSLSQINIIVACEEEFGVKFKIDDVVKLDSVGTIVNMIEEKMRI